MIYLTAIGFPPGGSSTVHIYIQTIKEQHTSQLFYSHNSRSSEFRPFKVALLLCEIVQLTELEIVNIID
jgi:hypothetical protein